MMRRIEQLKGLLKTGVAATALYAGGMGLTQAEPMLDYVSNEAVVPIVQTVQKAQASRLHTQENLSKTKLNNLLDHVEGGAWFSGHEGQVSDNLEELAQTKIGQSVLSKVPDEMTYRIASQEENKTLFKLGMGGSYQFDQEEIMLPPWLLDEMKEQTPLIILHESVHAAQKNLGAMEYRQITSPHVYSLGEQLIEADAVAAELALLREKPELMPEHKFANGRDDMLPYFNQMWQKNYETYQNEDQATQMTRKQFIQKMILNQNPEMVYSENSTSEQKCNYQITNWKHKYQMQINNNFDAVLKEQFDNHSLISLKSEKNDKMVEKTAALFGFSKEEANQLYQAVQKDDNYALNMKAVALGDNPNSFEDFQNKEAQLYEKWQKDSDTSIEFANQNLKEQVNAAYGNLVEKGLTKTLAEKSTPQKEGMSLLTQLNKLQNLNAEKEKQTQNSDKMITATVINVGGQNR